MPANINKCVAALIVPTITRHVSICDSSTPGSSLSDLVFLRRLLRQRFSRSVAANLSGPSACDAYDPLPWRQS